MLAELNFVNRRFWAGCLRASKPMLLNLGLGVASLAVALSLAELGVRLVSPQQLILIRPDLWQPADTVGWLHRPNVSVRINTGERTVDVFTDSNGFRVGAEGPLDPGPGGREVLLLGDSFVEALQVAHEASAAGILEKQLPEMVGTEVAVRNAGIGGWDPDQYALRARSLLEHHSYDVVVVSLYLGNDVIPTRRPYLPPRTPVVRYRLRLPQALTGQEITDALLRPVNDFFEVRSHLYVFTRSRLRTLQMRLGLTPLSFPSPFIRSEVDAPRWEVTASICEDIAKLASEHGADAVFMLVPAAFQVDSVALARYVSGFDLDPESVDLEQPNRLLLANLSARGLDVHDALPAFRAAHAAGQALFGRVDHHLSPEGNRLFADLIARVVADIVLERAGGAKSPA